MSTTPSSGPVSTDIGPDFYSEISKTRLDFPSAVCELIDNSIVNTPKVPGAFRIEVILSELAGGELQLLIADDSIGIPRGRIEDGVFRTGLRKAVPRAASPQYAGLSEHGFGLKFALAWLAQNSSGEFDLRTASKITGRLEITSVVGVLRPGLVWSDSNVADWNADTIKCGHPARTGTRIRVKLPFWQAARGWIERHAAAECKSIEEVAEYLVEHLGVVYRHLLVAHANSKMYVAIRKGGTTSIVHDVRPIPVPYEPGFVNSFNIVARSGGHMVRAKLTVGHISYDPGRNVFYRYNQDTQGIDISCNMKILQMHVFEHFWRGIGRHNALNAFAGELEILTPVSTYVLKNEINWGDPMVLALSRKVETLGSPRTLLRNSVPPPATTSTPPAPPPPPVLWNFAALIEDQLRDLLAARLREYDPSAQVPVERNTWVDVPAHVDDLPIDVTFEDSTGSVVLFEVKRGNVTPEDLYQLRMYWDGKVLQGARPKKAWIVGAGMSPTGFFVLNFMKNTPDRGGVNYIFEFKNWAVSPWPAAVVEPKGPLSPAETAFLSTLV